MPLCFSQFLLGTSNSAASVADVEDSIIDTFSPVEPNPPLAPIFRLDTQSMVSWTARQHAQPHWKAS